MSPTLIVKIFCGKLLLHGCAMVDRVTMVLLLLFSSHYF